MENEKYISHKNYLLRYFENSGINLTSVQADQFLLYYELLTEKNKVMNLTAITDFEDVVRKHFMDSVLIIKVLENHISSVIDVGTGAGFPGIPLKILFPDSEVLLLDSLNKRISFLNEVIDKLELKKITTIHGRAEDIARKSDYREHYDLCVSRAVAKLSVLSEYSLPFVRKGGFFISYKANEIELECNQAKKAISILGGKVVRIEKTMIPETDMERSFVIIKKEKGTSPKYPRKAGLPVKCPL